MQFTEKNNDDQDPLEEKVLRREKLTLKLRSVKERQAKKDTRRATKTDELLAQIDDIQKEVKYRTALRMAEWGERCTSLDQNDNNEWSWSRLVCVDFSLS